jgi:hypothetical protein
MEAAQFDALTKTWLTTPRRKVLGGLVLGALGTLLGHGGREAGAISVNCQQSSDCLTGEACVHHACTLTCADPLICVNGAPNGGTGCPGGCFCAKKPGGGGVCLQAGGVCSTTNHCKKQRNCPAGQICGSACCPRPKFSCLAPCVL